MSKERFEYCQKWKYVLVIGFGWSGSSAVVDLLKEYDGIYSPDEEFRIIKDPYCLCDLRNSLIEHWDSLNSDNAICDFIWHVKKMDYCPTRYSFKDGLAYERFFNGRFLKAADSFINSIIGFNYKSHWWLKDFKKTRWEIFSERLKHKLFHIEPERKMYFSDIEASEFDARAKLFLDSLFEGDVDEEKTRIIVLDQAVALGNLECAKNFFDNAKIIIVDRDPRDIYLDLKDGDNLIGADLNEQHDAMKYVRWHKALRMKLSDACKEDDVKLIRFEDLICRYEETVKEIEEFVGLSDEQHIDKKKYLDPSISIKNIGMWKEYDGKDEMSFLTKELQEYIVK